MNTQDGNAGYILPEEGRMIRLGAELLTFKMRSAETGGAYSLVEDLVVEPQGGPPPHFHYEEHEVFYILEGKFAFHVGSQTREIGPGEIAFVPKGVVHNFQKLGAEPGRMLVIIWPGGQLFEGFVEEAGEPAADKSVLLQPITPNIEKLVAAAQRHGIGIPPPQGQ